MAWNDAVLERDLRFAFYKSVIATRELEKIVENILLKAAQVAAAAASTYVTTHELDDLVLQELAREPRDPRYTRAWCYHAAAVLHERDPRALARVVENIHVRIRATRASN